MNDFFDMSENRNTADFEAPGLMDLVDSAIEASNEYETEVTAVGIVLNDLSAAADMCLTMADAMTTAKDNGGLTAPTLAIANAALTAQFAKYRAESTTVASMESLEQADGAVAVAGFGIEKATDMFKKAWDWALKQLKKLRQVVMKFYDRQISIVGRNGKALTALAKAAGDRSGTPKESTVEPSKVQYLLKDGSLPTNLVAEVGLTAKVVRVVAFSKALNKAVETATKEYEDAAGVSEPTEASLKAAAEKGSDAIFVAATSAFGLKENVKDKRLEKETDPYSLGDTGLGDTRVAAIKRAKVTRLSVLLPEEPKKAIKVKAMSQSEIANLCTEAADLVDTILSKKDGQRDFEKVYPSVEKAGKALQAALNSDAKSSVKSELNGLINAAVSVERDATEVSRGIIAYGSNVAAACLSYAKASYSNIQEKK